MFISKQHQKGYGRKQVSKIIEKCASTIFIHMFEEIFKPVRPCYQMHQVRVSNQNLKGNNNKNINKRSKEIFKKVRL